LSTHLVSGVANGAYPGVLRQQICENPPHLKEIADITNQKQLYSFCVSKLHLEAAQAQTKNASIIHQQVT